MFPFSQSRGGGAAAAATATAWNPTDAATGYTFTNSNRTATLSAANGDQKLARSVSPKSSGKWSLSVKGSGSNYGLSFVPSNVSLAATDATNYILIYAIGQVFINGSNAGTIANWDGGKELRAEIDFTAKTLLLSVDGASQGSFSISGLSVANLVPTSYAEVAGSALTIQTNTVPSSGYLLWTP